MQISGSSAVVFGGAGGLGEATVRKLHAAGVKVVIADLADDKGKELAAELAIPYVRTDVTNDEFAEFVKLVASQQHHLKPHIASVRKNLIQLKCRITA